MTWLVVIGLDGSPPSPESRDLLERASLVVGAARYLAAVSIPESARTVVLGDLTTALDAIDAELDYELDQEYGSPDSNKAPVSGGSAGRGRVVVLASGDPGFFGIVRALRARGRRPRVIPALSSVARAFAKAGLPWDDALVVSAHGRELRRAVNACRAHPKVAVLTGPGTGPAELARELFPQTPRTFVVCEDLGGPHERVVNVRPAEASTRPWREPNVVLVLDQRRVASGGERGWIAGARLGPTGWGLPDSAFGPGAEHGALVRAFALAKLGPRVGDMVWDVGSGRGEIAIECARFGAAVVAIERDEAACERIRANVRAHRVKVAVSRGTAPVVLEHLPEPDAVFVGGGGPEVAQACASRALRSVVVVLGKAECVQAAVDALKGESLTTEAISLQANPVGATPGKPVFVVWGERGGDVPSVKRPSQAGKTIARLPDLGSLR